MPKRFPQLLIFNSGISHLSRLTGEAWRNLLKQVLLLNCRDVSGSSPHVAGIVFTCLTSSIQILVVMNGIFLPELPALNERIMECFRAYLDFHMELRRPVYKAADICKVKQTYIRCLARCCHVPVTCWISQVDEDTESV